MSVYEFGPFRFEPRESRLLQEGRPVPLSSKEVETLLALVERSGSLVTKRELMDRVWPGQFVEENSLTKCVSALRKALGDRRSGPRFIETVAKHGYRFVAEVRRRGQADVLPSMAPWSGDFGDDRSITVRVTVELLSSADGSTLWTERLDGTESGRIAALLSGRAREEPRGLRGRATRDAYAHRLHSEAGYHVMRYTSAGWRKSVACYEAALVQDPSFALAHADLAIASVLASVYYTHAETVRQRAREAARRALALDPGLPEAHQATALVRYLLDGDWEGAESSFHQALALDPGQAWSHDYYGFYLVLMGRSREALPVLERAAGLDPVRIMVNGDLGLYHHFTGAVDGAIDHHQRALELDPLCGLTHVDHARALERAGRYREAIAEARRTLRLDDTPWVRVWLARSRALAGQHDEARRLLREIRRAADQGTVSPVFPALVHAALGERAEALTLLQEACAQRSPWRAFLGVEPAFAELREEPGFTKLLRRAGLGKL